MSFDPSNPEHPDGVDQTAVPGDVHIPRAAKSRTRGLAVRPPRTKAPLILTADDNPVDVVSEFFNLAVVANSLLVEDFGADEITRELINLFRDDPDPKVRLAAADRLMKLFKDSLIGSGAIAKVTDTAKIRSPDGTTAEREVVTRQVLRSFERSAPYVPKPVIDETSPALPDPSPGPKTGEGDEGR